MNRKIAKILTAALAAATAAGTFAGCSGSAGSVDGNETALIVNGEEIPYGEVNMFVRYQQAQTYYYMQSLGMNSGNFWSSEYTYEVDENGSIVEASSGSDTETDSESSSAESSSSSSDYTEVTSTYGEYFKKLMLEEFVKLVVARQEAVNEYGVELTEEEQKTIADTAKTFMDTNADFSETYGATAEMVEDILELYTYRADLKPYATEDVDREVSDEEAAQSTVLYLRIMKNSEEDASSEDGEEAKTDEELLADAENVLEQIKAAGDITEDEANEIADSVNEDFFGMEFSIGADDTTFPDEVNEALATLKDGEVYDGVIDTDDFYYIVKMISVFDEEATENEKEYIISNRENEAYNEAIDQWAAEASVEEQGCLGNIELKDNEVYTFAAADTSFDTSEQSDTGAASESSVSSGTDTGSETDAASESSADSQAESASDSAE